MHFALLCISLLLMCPAVLCGQEYKVTDLAFLDVEIAGEQAGRIVIGLFGENVPKTAKNFITIASKGVEGKTYAGSPFHRVIANFMIQGGDIISGDGNGFISIYGTTFNDESVDIKHSAPGFVGMAKSGPNTNGCQFYIITQPTPWLDGKFVVFGKVTEGMDVVHKIEHLKTNTDDRPELDVKIVKSGSLPLNEPFNVSDDANDLSAWVKASMFPLLMSFVILGTFHWFYKKLDMATAGT